MADANYPLPGFHFSVDFGGTIINCIFVIIISHIKPRKKFDINSFL